MNGFFMTFEGIEGSGKSTVARLVADELEKAGIDVLLTREPGGTRISEAIRAILLDPDRAEISARAELLMYLASRAQLVDEVISPALREGRIVICDRFMDASVAYQGWARGLGENVVEHFNSFTVGGSVPDVTFLFDLSVEAGFSRGPEKREADGVQIKDRLEREARSFHEKVREGYLRIAGREPGRFVVIDAALSLSEVTEAVLGNIRPRLDVQF
ncbi:MAG: dTMP kinase [Candidatus Krumholzibacteria bacterium]|nr:dTMP kinase [Candidatus Krumholzibacteria bacterium]